MKKEQEKDESEEEKSDDKKSETKEENDSIIVVELDGIEDRIVRVTPNSSDIADAVIANDGEKACTTFLPLKKATTFGELVCASIAPLF